MIDYNNDIDDSVDDTIYDCINPNKPKSFFLFAGAGSGKTRTLVKVLTNFKNEYGIDFKFRNKKIAIITYTNAAADEITDRLEHNSTFKVSTIHSFSWELIKNFTSDIKNFLRVSLNSEIMELDAQQSKSRNLLNKTSRARSKKIESKTRRLETLSSIQKFIYNPNGDNITKDSLNHSEVISIVAEFIKSKALFRQIVINKYPIILIDESQDTKKDLIEALFDLQAQYKNQFSLGLFGDTMQRIYSDGKEDLGNHLPIDWIQPAKKMNHRSQPRIIALINKIRNEVDGQEQFPRTEKSEGIVRFFAVSRLMNKEKTEEIIRGRMQKLTQDHKWSGSQLDVMTLTLEHHMAAKRMGFSTFFDALYVVDKLKTGLLDGSSPSINLFLKVIIPLYNAHIQQNKFEIANVVKKHSGLLAKEIIFKEDDKPSIYQSVNLKVNKLLDLWDNNNEPSLLEVLENINESNLFTIPLILKMVLAQQSINIKDDGEENELEDEEILSAWNLALKAKFSEIIRYNEYINGDSTFGTHQGVKGLEFERVMVIIDDDEARGFMFNYEKLFGIKEKTKNDLDNMNKGIETGIDRTRRLFYVACSRAKESLAIVAYTDSAYNLKDNIVNYGWFSDDEVIVIDK